MTTASARPAPRAPLPLGRAHTDRLVAALSGLDTDRLEAWGTHLADLLGRRGGRLLVAGNGGSAAEAQHLTAELVGRMRDDREPLSALALHAETSTLTAVSNDYGYDEAFARQVAAHGRRGDVLLLLSTSGRSRSCLRAAEVARAGGLVTWGLCGLPGSPLALACDEAVTVDAPETATVQEVHLAAVHLVCAAVDVALGVAPADREALPRDADGPVRRGLPLTGGTSDPPLSADVPSPYGTPPRLPARTTPVPAARVSAAGARPLRGPVVVVGDVLLDRDLVGRVERVAPDAPVPVVEDLEDRARPGGAGLAALLAARDGRPVTLVCALGDDAAGARVRDLLRRAGVHVVDLGGGPTPEKIRVRADGQSLLRLDRGGRGGAVGDPGAEVRDALEAASAVLVSCYGRGVSGHAGVRALLEAAAGRVPLVWDPHPRGPAPVAGARLVTPNAAEAGVRGTSWREVTSRAGDLRDGWSAAAVAVTLSARGALLVQGDAPPLVVPVPADPSADGGDPCGAGDRFASAVAGALADGALPSEAVAAAVAAASVFVRAGGAAAVAVAVGVGGVGVGPGVGSGPSVGQDPTVDALDALDALGPSGPSPVEAGAGTHPEWADAAALAARVRAAGGTVVATGGCFDLLHAGHVGVLEAARGLGDCLVVVLNSDSSVRRLKGPERPLVGQEDRARVLLALGCVDAVAVFDEDTPAEALAALRADVFAKGGDYALTDIPEAGVVAGWGGQAVVLPYLDGRSSTRLMQEAARRGSEH